MAFGMVQVSVWIWILREIRLFILLVLLHIHISGRTINDGRLRNPAIIDVLVDCADGIHSLLLLILMFIDRIHVLNMANILSQIRNISCLEFSLTMVRVVEIPWLDALCGLHLSIVPMVLLVALGRVLLIHAVSHVDSSCTQKACGFVQSWLVWILSCLRVGHLSGIELLTDLGLVSLEASSIGRVLMPTTLSSHLYVLFVIEVTHDGVVLWHSTNDLGLVNLRPMHVRIIILTLFWEEVLRVCFVFLYNAVGGSTTRLV